MDWKLDKKKRERNMAFARTESSAKVDMLQKMDLEFEKIFGVDTSVALSHAWGKAGDPVRRTEARKMPGPRKAE